MSQNKRMFYGTTRTYSFWMLLSALQLHLFTYYLGVSIVCVCVRVCLFVCYGSYNELIWWQCVSAIDPCVPHLVGTHTQPAVTAVQSGDHHAQQTHKHTHTHTKHEALSKHHLQRTYWHTYTHTHPTNTRKKFTHRAWKWIPQLSQALHILITFQCYLHSLEDYSQDRFL